MNKKIIAVVIVVLGFAAGGIIKSRMNVRQDALAKIESLIVSAQSEKKEMIELYDRRQRLLLDWEKSARAALKKLPAALTVPEQMHAPRAWDLKTESDLESYDAFQNSVTNLLSNYLGDESVRKYKPKELEHTEEMINRKRHAYHSDAFDANGLIQKFDSERPSVPAFRAEKELQKSGQWNRTSNE
ncbi:MAG: hypothetical protein JST80_01430 [Bdellovibrionales bacterium]|nr:hypothetical protein [Bdellovibrionales bacterium]